MKPAREEAYEENLKRGLADFSKSFSIFVFKIAEQLKKDYPIICPSCKSPYWNKPRRK